MKKNDIIRILILVFAVLIAALVIGGGIYLFTASKKVKALQITPDFTETELNINGQYSFTVSATPAKASIKKVDCIVDDPTATFEMEKDGKATLITGGSEGTVTVYIEYKDIKSNVLTFQVVDQAAKAAAEAAAAAEAQAAAEAEAASAKKYVQMTGDNVNVRAQNNTDCDILGKAKKGEMFEKVEDVDEWSHIMFNGQDGYIKSEFLTEITEEQFLAGGTAAPAEEEKKEEKKEEEKKEEEKKEEQQPTQEVTPEASTDDAAKAAAEAQAQQELLAQAMAAAATAAPAATGSLPASGPWTYQGVTFTANQVAHFHALWDYTGDAAEMVTHHSAGELQTVCDVDGVH